MTPTHRDTMHTRLAPSNEPRELWSPHRPQILSTTQRRIRAIANTPTLDRWGTRILPEGMQVVPNSPVPLLFQHREPAGRIEQIERTAGAIIFDAIVLDDRAWNLVRTEQVSGISIGFVPLEWDFDRDDTPICRAWQLGEISLVAVPANPEAKITEVRSWSTTEEPAMPPLTPPARTEQPAAAPRLVQSIPAAAPAVHRNRAQPYDVGKALRAAAQTEVLDGLEAEVAKELEQRAAPAPTRGVRIPAVLFKRTISTDPASIGALSPSQYLGQLLDDTSAARKWAPLLQRCGFVQINSERESVLIPKRDSRVRASWGGKDTEAAASEWTATDDTVVPRYVMATHTLERSALKYATPAALQLTLADLGDAIDGVADDGLLFGGGAGNVPNGLLSVPGRTVDLAGESVTTEELLDLKNTLMETWKQDLPTGMRWIMNARNWDALRTTSRKTGAGADTEWAAGIAPFSTGDNVLFDIGVLQSGKVAMRGPNQYDIYLTYSAMGVVVWFGGGSIDTYIDMSTLSTRGAARVSGFLNCNCVARDPQIVHMLANVLAAPPIGAARRAPAAA